MDKLFIHLTEQERVACLRVGERGESSASPQHLPLEEIASRASGCQVIVLVPADRVILTSVAVPTSNRQRQAQAVPYLLEELLADDVEQLHFALGSYREGEVAVAVVAHEQMRRWLERLTAAGIPVKLMVPDLLAIPLGEREWSVVVGEAVTWIRTGVQSGLCCDTENLSLLLGQLLQHAGDEEIPRHLKIADCRNHKEKALDTLLPQGVEFQRAECGASLLSRLAVGYEESGGNAINLLQGAYSQRERLGKLWRPWRPVAALLGALLLVQGAVAAVEYRRLSAEKERLVQQVEQSFRQGFPSIKRIVNPKLQAERALKSLRGQGGGAGFFALMAEAGPPLQSVSGATLKGINYKEGRMVLDIRLKSLQQLDELEQKLKQNTAQAIEVLSASSRNKHVEARIKIGGGQ